MSGARSGHPGGARIGHLGLGSNVGDRRANLQSALDGFTAHAVRLAAELALELLAGVQQRRRLQLRLDPQARVEEGRLVEDLAHRVGVVDAR